MTAPGDGSGENREAKPDQSPPDAAAAHPEQGSSPAGFEAYPGPESGYPPPGYDARSSYPPPTYGAPSSYPPPPYGPPPGYPPPGYGTQYPGASHQPGNQPRPKTSVLAITALVLAIIGIFFLPLSIVGIVLGAVALSQIKKTGEAGYGLAVGGIAVGTVTLLVGFFFMVLAILAAH